VLPFQPPWKVPAILNASTCVVVPEDEEEPYFPEGTHGSKVPLEAMLCAKCTVIGRGMSKKPFYSSCKDGKHFLVVNPNKIKEFAQKLKMVVDNPSEARKIGLEAREFMLKNKPLFKGAVDSFIKNLLFTILKSK
jgi:glycosyltransferase involved in cell wall biosynthesis